MPSQTAAATLSDPAFHGAILGWYRARGRHLPFRATSDPWAVLVSEVMAQQTQAARAAETWTRFMATYPTVASVAAATPADVLRAWQGLGYNRRALHLWRAAGRIVAVHGGRVPSDLADLQDLPGVGPYTARAIGAIAFGLRVGAVDTNVRRVLRRVLAGDPVAAGTAGLQRVADSAVPPDAPGDWTHALMDLGATVCRPRAPACAGCPVRVWCRHAAGVRDDDADTPRRAARVPPASSRATRKPATPFPRTSRWLRGRIIDHLRDTDSGAWLAIGAPIGEHGDQAIAAALHALARDGLVELDADGDGGRLHARLAVG